MKLKHWFAFFIIGALIMALWALTSTPPEAPLTPPVTPSGAAQAAVHAPHLEEGEEEVEAAPEIKRAAEIKRPAPKPRPQPRPAPHPAPRVQASDAAPQAPAADAEPLPQKMIWSTDREGIQGAIRESVPEIRECYDAWVKAYPEMEGRLIASFTISADEEDPEKGSVQEVQILDSELKHKMMEGCVLDVMSELRFVAPSGGNLTVRYPFNFQSQPEGE